LRWKRRRNQTSAFRVEINRGSIRVHEANELQSRPVAGNWGDKAEVGLGVNEAKRNNKWNGVGHGWGGAVEVPGNERVRVYELG
jgi:hypothetical protein